MMNNTSFYVVHAYVKTSDQYEIMGIFSKKEDADDFMIKSYSEPNYLCSCVERLSMNEIKTVLVKERLLSLSEVLEPFIDRLWTMNELK